MPELSIHDQQLSPTAKQGIRAAKNSYNKAKQNNDTIGMARANEYANSIRRHFGGYTGGDDGSAYYPVPTLSESSKPAYSSSYDSKIKKAQKSIADREEFSYDPEKDPVYKLYKKIYTQLGNDAYDRAMAQNSIKTGGIVNTNAATSAIQAQNYYNSAIADKMTELYDKAYKKYTDEINRDYDILNMYKDAEDAEYKKFLDEMEEFTLDRNFEYKKYLDDTARYDDAVKAAADRAYSEKQNKEDDSYRRAELDYKAKSDADKLAYDFAKLGSDGKKWQEQAETDRYNALARLISSIYNKSNIGVDVNAIMKLLGLR